MKIHLPSHPRGVHHIHETVDPAELSLESAVFARPVEVDVTLDRHDPYLELDIALRTPVISLCDRCLTEYQWEMTGATPMLYVLGRPPAGDAVDDPGIGYLPANTTDVDLTGDIRDLIILSLPGKYLCREDCLGLCPICGADLNEEDCAHSMSQV